MNKVRPVFLLGKVFWLGCALILGSVGFGEAETLNQTDFENGEMAVWETFVTLNGTMGETEWPLVAPFETTEEGRESKSLKFKVGQIRYDKEQEAEQGGGLVMDLTTKAGMIDLSVHVAVSYNSPKDRRNLAGGLFEWIVDDQVIVSHDIGPIKNHGILRHHLKGHHLVPAGLHTIRLRITRPFVSVSGQHAPHQYVDNLLIRLSP